MAFKIKTNESGLMKMYINSTIFCFYLWCDLYAEIDFGVHMRSGYTQPHPPHPKINKYKLKY